NPTQKVPTLIHGDTTVWESNTVLRYLAYTTQTPLYPADAAERTRVETWMDWLLASVNPVYLAAFKDAKKPEAERGANTAGNLASELKIMDQRLADKTWIAGDQISLADIALGPTTRRCVNFPYVLP